MAITVRIPGSSKVVLLRGDYKQNTFNPSYISKSSSYCIVAEAKTNGDGWVLLGTTHRSIRILMKV